MTETANVLVRWEDDIGDEIEFDGHMVLPADAWTRMCAHLMQRDKPYTFHLGDHTTREYKNGQDFLEHIRVAPLTRDQGRSLTELSLNVGGFMFVQEYVYAVKHEDNICLLTGLVGDWG